MAKKAVIGGTRQAKVVRGNTWVQTQRSAHEAWAQLTVRYPTAASVLHLLAANSSPGDNAVVVSYSTMAEMLGPSPRTGQLLHRNTIANAIKILERDHWIEVMRLGGRNGGVNAYIVNDRVCWSQARDRLYLSRVSGSIILNRGEQEQRKEIEYDDTKPALRRIPVLMDGELQAPDSSQEDPPAQQILPGLEPDLPAIVAHPAPEENDDE